MKGLGKTSVVMVALVTAIFMIMGTAGAERVKVSVAGAGPGATAYVLWGDWLPW
jgi:hypothetical protein